MRKFEKILAMLGASALLATAACSGQAGADGDATADGTADATTTDTGAGQDTTSGTDTSAGPKKYYWLVIYDSEAPDCSTTGPGADIDAVEVIASDGSTVGAGLKGSGDFVSGNPNAGITPCEKCGKNLDKDCAHAKDPIDNAMGLHDAQIYCGATSDTGYVSLNGGSLRFQVGSGTQSTYMQSGDTIKVYEVDESYKGTDDPTKCNGKGEKYQIEIRTEKDKAGVLLKLKSGSDTGTGVSEFVVP